MSSSQNGLPDGALRIGTKEPAQAAEAAEPQGPQGRLKGWQHGRRTQAGKAAEVTITERERIRQLARARAGQLLDAGLMTRKAAKLRTLGWPEAVRSTREARAS